MLCPSDTLAESLLTLCKNGEKDGKALFRFTNVTENVKSTTSTWQCRVKSVNQCVDSVGKGSVPVVENFRWVVCLEA